MDFKLLCFLVGFFGDAFLQIIVLIRGNIANLKVYFQRHGRLESMFIAGGMMFLFGWVYTQLQALFSVSLNNNYYLFLYGGLLDIIWRKFALFPSLTYTYYKANNPIQSFIWGGIPMMLPNLLKNLIDAVD